LRLVPYPPFGVALSVSSEPGWGLQIGVIWLRDLASGRGR